MPALDLDSYPLNRLADEVGTPFYLYDGAELGRRLADLTALTEGDALQARFAMKANSSAKVLGRVRGAGLWIDAVSGNEVLRARRAGFAMGAQPPVVMLTADVLRDITLGDNDTDGLLGGQFAAGPGWDACTGWGVPDGVKLLTVLKS